MNVEILQHAHHLILSGDQEFLCMAIAVAGRVLQAPDVARALRYRVSREVGGSTNILEFWVTENGGPTRLTLIKHPTWPTQMRLAWLDKLIAEHASNA